MLVRVRVRCNRQEAVRAAVTATPDLRAVLGSRAQDDQPSIREPAWPDGRAFRLPGAAERTDQASLNAAVESRPPARGTQERCPGCQGDGPWIMVRVVDDECTSFVSVTLPRRPASGIQDGDTGVEHPGQALPGCLGQRIAMDVRFDSGQ